MKQVVKRVIKYIVEENTADSYLFAFLFCSRIFIDLIIDKIFGLGVEWQHEIFTFYKLNYIFMFVYMFFYECCYLATYHKVHFTKVQWIGSLYACIAVIATWLFLKDKFAYNYFTKLSLGEMMMTMIFMFDVGTKSSKARLEITLAFCAFFYLGLTFLINTFSLIVLFFDLKDGVTLCGRYIVFPAHINAPNSLLGVAEYTGFFYNSSITGLCCSLAIFLLVWLFKTNRIKVLSFIFLTIINLYCLYLSLNRTGALGFLAFLTMLFFDHIHVHIKDKRKRRLIYILFLLFVLILFGWIIIRKKNFALIFNTLLTDPFNALDDLTSVRMRILVSIMKIVRSRPLFGNGWNSVIPIEGTSIVFPYAHNIFLGALAWTGIIGFVVFVVFFAFIMKSSIKMIHYCPEHKLLLFIMITLVLEAQFENGILGDWNHAYTYIFWVIAGFLGGKSFSIKKSAEHSI